MRNFWKFLRTFIKHWYTFLILLASDPFDISERWFGMNYAPPQYLFWVLLGVATCIALLLTIHDLRLAKHNNRIAWEVYDNLVKLFRELMNTDDAKQRAEKLALIETERGKLPDKQLDVLINLFLDAEAESAKLGLDPLHETSLYLLRVNNERMRNHINSKYGERIWNGDYAVSTVSRSG